MKYYMLTLALMVGLFSCQTNTAQNNESPNHFGEKITADGAINLATLLTKLEGSEKVETKVRGKVESVCQAKGCWMNIVNDAGDEIFVKFKDYGFFMPMDCAGKEVIMEGVAYKEVTSVEELRHYAEDNGDSPEKIAAITEPKEELKFMAKGVILVQ